MISGQQILDQALVLGRASGWEELTLHQMA